MMTNLYIADTHKPIHIKIRRKNHIYYSPYFCSYLCGHHWYLLLPYYTTHFISFALSKHLSLSCDSLHGMVTKIFTPESYGLLTTLAKLGFCSSLLTFTIEHGSTRSTLDELLNFRNIPPYPHCLFHIYLGNQDPSPR